VAGAKGMVRFEERFLEARGVRVRYYAGGDGRAVVLVHGLGGAASNWVDLAAVLAERHRVLIPDLPGHGGSSPLPAAPTLSAFADRVAVLLERERLARAVVVGHSLGGLVALRLACRFPERIGGLVLAGSAGFSPSSRRAEHALLVSSLVRPGRWVAPFRDRIAGSTLLRRLSLGWGVSDPDSLSAASVDGFLAGPALHTDVLSPAKALILEDLTETLEGVRCPCLVLWGARDRQTPIGDAFGYGRRLRAAVRTIPDCGHLLIGERPDACADAIGRFAVEAAG
jgi:pimeloyl-ACP methyl ester carboxylesterase